MSEVAEGAQVFAEMTLNAFAGCGVEAGSLKPLDEVAVSEDDTVVILGVVGAWHGAVAFRFDAAAQAVVAEAMAGRPVEDEAFRAEALLEASNIVSGRGVAALAETAEGIVWLTPPILARGTRLKTRLHNTTGHSFGFRVGPGTGALVFAAARTKGRPMK